MVTNTEAEAEEAEDSRMFRDALLNGDEKFNKFVKLTDSRFDSQARRTNKLRVELREEMAELRQSLRNEMDGVNRNINGLRSDLKPAIDLAKAWPYIAGIFGGLGALALTAYTMGLIP